jgi:hypothetical protein
VTRQILVRGLYTPELTLFIATLVSCPHQKQRALVFASQESLLAERITCAPTSIDRRGVSSNQSWQAAMSLHGRSGHGHGTRADWNQGEFG